MRHLALILSLLTLTACGSDSPTAPQNTTPPAPTTATVFFRIDGVTCTGVDAISLYIDGTIVGTQTLAAGGSTSSGFTTSIGSHAFGAKEVNGGFVWPTTVLNVPSNGLIDLLTCN